MLPLTLAHSLWTRPNSQVSWIQKTSTPSKLLAVSLASSTASALTILVAYFLMYLIEAVVVPLMIYLVQRRVLPKDTIPTYQSPPQLLQMILSPAHLRPRPIVMCAEHTTLTLPLWQIARQYTEKIFCRSALLHLSLV